MFVAVTGAKKVRRMAPVACGRFESMSRSGPPIDWITVLGGMPLPVTSMPG